MYDMNTPGGASLQRRGDAYRIVLGNSKLVQIAAAALWVIGSGIWWVGIYRPGVLPFNVDVVPRQYAGWIWLAATGGIWFFTVRHIVVTVTEGTMVVVYHPLHLPTVKRIDMARVRHFDIDTVIRTHRDSNGHERDSYVFRVQASLTDDWYAPIVLSTRNEANAVWLRHTLENVREMVTKTA